MELEPQIQRRCNKSNTFVKNDFQIISPIQSSSVQLKIKQSKQQNIKQKLIFNNDNEKNKEKEMDQQNKNVEMKQKIQLQQLYEWQALISKKFADYKEQQKLNKKPTIDGTNEKLNNKAKLLNQGSLTDSSPMSIHNKSQTNNKPDVPMTINHLKKRVSNSAYMRSMSASCSDFDSKQKWKKVRNIMLGVYLFKKPEVHTITTVNELEENMTNENDTFLPVKRMRRRSQDSSRSKEFETNSQYNIRVVKEDQDKAFFEVQNQMNFILWVTRGSKSDAELVVQAIVNDPKNYLLAQDSPDRLVNRVDVQGHSPLYIACKNGNLQIVKILMQNHANPFALFSITESSQESILEVSARWGLVDITKYLLESVMWEKKHVLSALHVCQNQEIQQYLKIYLNVHNMTTEHEHGFVFKILSTFYNSLVRVFNVPIRCSRSCFKCNK